MELPAEFVESIRPLLKEEWSSFLTALDSVPPPVSIRTNPRKTKSSYLSSSPVPWSKTGFYLDHRPSFTFDPSFHAGSYYVQEASSMFIEQVFEKYVYGDVKVLDLCAAPGGKSSHIASLITENSLLVSNEVIRNRANILSENIIKTGYSNVIITNSDPGEMSKLDSFFDVVLVDAPCSGEGMFRKDHDSISEWSSDNVRLCRDRQRRIIADVWSALKPGGILIYSTCTYNRSENEDNVIWVQENLGAETLSLDVDEEWGISSSYDERINAYHFFPHKVKGEGFFLAVLRKKDDVERGTLKTERKPKSKKNTKAPSLLIEYRDYIIGQEKFTFFNKEDRWFAFPQTIYENFLEIVSALRLVSAGICLGEMKGKDFVPHHSLAMSVQLNLEKFNSFDIDKDTAIAYLRKDILSFNHLPKGYILLTYRGLPLGFVKNIGNRVNNLYPNDWRIRSLYKKD